MNLTFDSYAEIGRYLRECRESLQLTTRGISAQLHIRAKYLDALETGQLSEIPGGVYVKGYLAAYAEFLGLDKQGLVAAYEQMGKGPQRRKIFLSIPTSTENIPEPRVIVFSLLFILALCIVWWLARPDAAPRPDVGEVPMAMLQRFTPRQTNSPLLVWHPECSVAYAEGATLRCDELALGDKSIGENRHRRSVVEAW